MLQFCLSIVKLRFTIERLALIALATLVWSARGLALLAKVEFLRRQSHLKNEFEWQSESFTIACIKSVENYSTDAQKEGISRPRGNRKTFFPFPAFPAGSRLAAAFAVSGPLLPLRRPA